MYLAQHTRQNHFSFMAQREAKRKKFEEAMIDATRHGRRVEEQIDRGVL
jgi:hypothetical protein